jgi:hypothetical protein
MPHKDKDTRASYMREWRARHPDKRKRDYIPEQAMRAARKHRLKYLYGVTPEWYDEQFERQRGLCFLCKQPETRRCNGELRRLCIDHDHVTGAARKLLCSRCNSCLGWAEHIGLPKIIEYLK